MSKMQQGVDIPVSVNVVKVEMIESFKFLHIIITSFSQINHIAALAKKAHQRFYLLRRLRRCSVSYDSYQLR